MWATARRLLGLTTPLLLAATSACGGSGAVSPLVATPGPSPTPLAANAIDATITQAYPPPWGTEVAIYQNGALLYARGYGLRDRGLPDSWIDLPNFWNLAQPDVAYGLQRGPFAPDANSLYDIGSVTKQFTAAAILLLAQDGKLSLNDSLAKYFAGFPMGDQITLLDLMQHRSGLIDYVDEFTTKYPAFNDAYEAFMQSGQTDYSVTVSDLQRYPLDFAPGSQYEYSNSNYLMLGLIVAKVSGETLGAFLQQRIFTPLKMTQTHFGDYGPPPQADIALGYGDFGSGVVRRWQWNLLWMGGAGGITSTVGDLEKWDQAVRTPGIFTQATLAQMFTPSPIPSANLGSYAAGWFVSSLDGRRFVWHDGAIGGYQSINATFPDSQLDIIILTNDSTGTAPYFLIPSLLNAVAAPASRTVRRSVAL